MISFLVLAQMGHFLGSLPGAPPIYTQQTNWHGKLCASVFHIGICIYMYFFSLYYSFSHLLISLVLWFLSKTREVSSKVS